ncbi:MAG: hypothetical protein Q9219_005338 [cf. Caloplaca sp. 3 TL-2023]
MTFPSRACYQCKQRRVKCDETRPSCHRCQKANLTCSGSGEGGDLIFLNENEYAIGQRQRPRGPNVNAASKARKIALKTTSSETESCSRSQDEVLVAKATPINSQSCVLVPALVSPLEDRALAYYSRNHTEAPDGLPAIADGWIRHLKYTFEEWSRSRHDSVLSHAVLAVSHATLGRARQDHIALTAGSREYSKALVRTNMSLANAKEASTDEVLLAVMLLSFYENSVMDKISPVSRRTIEAMCSKSFAHHDGATAMLKMRQQVHQRTDRGIELDKLVRRQLMKTLLLRSMNVPSWLRDGSKFGENGLAFDLDDYMARAAKIRHEAGTLYAEFVEDPISDRHHELPRLYQTLTNAQTLDDDLKIWSNRLPKEFEYSLYSLENNTYAWTEKLVFESSVHQYSTTGHAGVWNRVRTVRLILNDIMLRILSLFNQRSIFDTQILEQAASSRIHCLANDLCASIPYVFGLS